MIQKETLTTGGYKKATKGLAWSLALIFIVEFVLIILVLAGMSLLRLNGVEFNDDLVQIGLVVVIGLAAIPVLQQITHVSKLTEQFWKELGNECGYTYTKKPWFTTDALIFQEGHAKGTGHGLLGTLDDHAFRLYTYFYSVGSGKSRRTYNYTVIEVSFAGTVPHLYLNNKRNRNLSLFSQLGLPELRLPGNLSEKYSLFVPKGYEMEALTVFTPDVLLHIQEEEWPHDIELVKNTLYIFSERSISTKEELNTELTRTKKILSLLSRSLSRATLSPIGDLKHTL